MCGIHNGLLYVGRRARLAAAYHRLQARKWRLHNEWAARATGVPPERASVIAAKHEALAMAYDIEGGT